MAFTVMPSAGEVASERAGEADDAAFAGDVWAKPVVTEPNVLEAMLTTRPH